MSTGYAKLFGSILASTIWQRPDHVRLVWITMLAMKDRDGIVHAAVPGLAHHARVTVAQAEEALADFLSPDPYSRTPDHEGRRIEVVDGGWRLLNHDKYRDLLDDDDQRAKAAARQKRFREKHKPADPGPEDDERNVTSNGVTSRVRQADPDPSSSPAGPDRPRIELPDPRASDRAQIGGGDLTAELKRSSEHIRDVGEGVKVVWGELKQLRETIAGELGIEIFPLLIDDPGQRDLARRLREADSVELGLKQARHVLVCAAVEARASESMQWLTGSVFSDGSWRRKLAMRVEDVKREAERKRAGPAPRETPAHLPTRRMRPA